MSFGTAISGIKAASAGLGIIGNNIANSSTIGFKQSRGEFSDVYAASTLGTADNAIGSGVKLSSVSQQFTQGGINFTNNALDLAINGNGFFALSDGGTTAYSRAGNFSVDQSGYLVNGQGLKLLAYRADTAGAITGLVGDIKVDSSYVNPTPTGQIEVVANLDSRAVAPTLAWNGPYDAFATPPTAPSPDSYNNSTSATIYDGLGNAHVMNTYFVKTATPNQWQAYTLIDGVSVGGGTTLTFDQSGRFPTTSLPVEVNVAGWTPLDKNGDPTGAAAQTFAIDVSNSTQFGNDFAISRITQDGFSTRQLRAVEFDATGMILARYTNGQSRALGQVSLANFANPQGLQPTGNTLWVQTFASGPPTVSKPGTAGLGAIQSGALEASNVDVTEQLVTMIEAQRNFQANAQVIRTEDAVTQTVINLR